MMSFFRSAPRCLAVALLAAALPVAAGCAGGKGDVSGKVTYKNEVLKFGNVQFFTEGGVFVGEIREDGTYTVKGVPTGTAKLAVSSKDDEKFVKYMKDLSASAKAGKPPPPGKPEDFDKIPGKYSAHETSELTYEVKSGPQTHNIDLK